MGLKIHVNCDSQDQPLGTSGVDWVEFSEGNDKLIFTQGNTEVADGEDIPTQAELISAGVILTGSQIILSTYLLQDTSLNILKSIDGMGNLNKSYVLAFEFDASTASEPVLEVYDNASLNTIDSVFLGSGSPTNSFIRAITTTYSPPGTNWINAGIRLSGSSDGHFLYLNDQNGFLIGADTLYCNLCVVIPASQTVGFSTNPVFVCKWLGN